MQNDLFKTNKLKKNKFNNLKLIKFVDDRKGHDLRYAINNNKIKKDFWI